MSSITEVTEVRILGNYKTLDDYEAENDKTLETLHTFFCKERLSEPLLETCEFHRLNFIDLNRRAEELMHACFRVCEMSEQIFSNDQHDTLDKTMKGFYENVSQSVAFLQDFLAKPEMSPKHSLERVYLYTKIALDRIYSYPSPIRTGLVNISQLLSVKSQLSLSMEKQNFISELKTIFSSDWHKSYQEASELFFNKKHEFYIRKLEKFSECGFSYQVDTIEKAIPECYELLESYFFLKNGKVTAEVNNLISNFENSITMKVTLLKRHLNGQAPYIGNPLSLILHLFLALRMKKSLLQAGYKKIDEDLAEIEKKLKNSADGLIYLHGRKCLPLPENKKISILYDLETFKHHVYGKSARLPHEEPKPKVIQSSKLSYQQLDIKKLYESVPSPLLKGCRVVQTHIPSVVDAGSAVVEASSTMWRSISSYVWGENEQESVKEEKEEKEEDKLDDLVENF
ncbi:MAG: hypothetical protein H7A37_05245 [Chlamydiales bacterium]|nr:hypothetical protein [Chlamydiia bacterium]MCP5507685.1 hypothetical protein [Chlamydiales bacterium]